MFTNQKLILLGFSSFFLVLTLYFFLFSSSPQEAFLEEVEEMVQIVNNGGHLEVATKLSPELKEYIEYRYLPLSQALLLARKIDLNQKHQYRIFQLKTFLENEYAEVELERFHPENPSENFLRFTLPFTYQKDQWWVAEKFRSDQQWIPLYPQHL